MESWFFRIATNSMFTKLSAKKGIKLFNEIAVAAILKAYTHLENMNVAVPGNLNVLNPKNI